MRKLIFVLAIIGFITTASATVSTANTATIANATLQDEEAPAQSASFTQELKKRFIEGGPGFMGIVLICLILASQSQSNVLFS